MQILPGTCSRISTAEYVFVDTTCLPIAHHKKTTGGTFIRGGVRAILLNLIQTQNNSSDSRNRHIAIKRLAQSLSTAYYKNIILRYALWILHRIIQKFISIPICKTLPYMFGYRQFLNILRNGQISNRIFPTLCPNADCQPHAPNKFY